MEFVTLGAVGKSNGRQHGTQKRPSGPRRLILMVRRSSLCDPATGNCPLRTPEAPRIFVVNFETLEATFSMNAAQAPHLLIFELVGLVYDSSYSAADCTSMFHWVASYCCTIAERVRSARSMCIYMACGKRAII